MVLNSSFISCWKNILASRQTIIIIWLKLVLLIFMTYYADAGGLATGCVRSNCCDDILNLINHNLDTTIVFLDHSPPTHRAIMINSPQHQTQLLISMASFLRDIAGWWISKWHPGEQQEMAGQDEVLPATQFRDVSIFTIIYNTKLSDPSALHHKSKLLYWLGHVI